MSLRSEKGNFLAAHYDWLAVGVGLAALVAGGAFFAMTLGDDAEELAANEAAAVDRMKPTDCGVKPVDMSENQTAVRLTKSPVTVAEVPERLASFLASERRVFCKKCQKVISGDVKAFPKCPFCGEKQEEEKAIVLDADGDGLPDEWEKKFGLNPNSPNDAELDKDGDGFTNLEEYQAKTDPTDPKDHPDYLDSVKVQLPLKQTYLPILFTQATKIPTGWRCQFFDATKKDAKRGNTGYITAKVGDELTGYGYVVKDYEAKTEKREKKGMAGMKVNVDVSEVTLSRKSDGKLVKVVIGSPRTAKPVPVDVQATLVYERGTTKNFDVVPGQEIDLNGTKFKIAEIKAVGKGAKVTIENSLSGKKRVLEALEQ